MLGLRNRLLQLYGHPFSGNEHHFGIGNTDWIHERAFNKDIQMHFGAKIPIESFRNADETGYNQIFDFIELYYARALEDLGIEKRRKLHHAVRTAFANSGSVYDFSEDGHVVLKIEENEAEHIADVDEILEPVSDARKVYRECIDGLVNRSKAPRDIVGDMYIVLEEFLLKATEQKRYEDAVRFLRENLGFHQTQLQIVEKLRAYRGDVWGSAHAGNSPEPAEADAIWYLESVMAQIKYVDVKVQDASSEQNGD